MAKTIFIMQGIPGSGKSTLAKVIADEHDAIIFSTDDFWYVHDETGIHYVYDAALLDVAHKWNQKRCVEEMRSKDGGNIVIDNTNITRWQAQPYLTFAKLYDYEVQVVRVSVPVEVAIERQSERPKDRRVPDETIRKMAEKMEDILSG